MWYPHHPTAQGAFGFCDHGNSSRSLFLPLAAVALLPLKGKPFFAATHPIGFLREEAGASATEGERATKATRFAMISANALMHAGSHHRYRGPPPSRREAYKFRDQPRGERSLPLEGKVAGEA